MTGCSARVGGDICEIKGVAVGLFGLGNRSPAKIGATGDMPAINSVIDVEIVSKLVFCIDTRIKGKAAPR